MKRFGMVAAINARRNMVAIRTDDDGYTIIELLSEFDLAVGDLVSWENGYGLGSEIYRNLSQGGAAEVFVQNHSVALEALNQQLLI